MIHYLSSSHLVVQTYFPVIKGGIRLDTENFSFRVNQKLRFDQKSWHTHFFYNSAIICFSKSKKFKKFWVLRLEHFMNFSKSFMISSYCSFQWKQASHFQEFDLRFWGRYLTSFYALLVGRGQTKLRSYLRHSSTVSEISILIENKYFWGDNSIIATFNIIPCINNAFLSI